MCYEVKCSTCSKTSWGGCGRHVPAVYKRIPQGEHCHCKAWPGVNSGDNSAAAPSSSCTILWSHSSPFYFGIVFPWDICKVWNYWLSQISIFMSHFFVLSWVKLLITEVKIWKTNLGTIRNRVCGSPKWNKITPM